MRFRAMFKTPDAIEYALDGEDLTQEEIQEQIDLCEKWVKYGELVRVDFDTDKMTAKVVELK